LEISLRMASFQLPSIFRTSGTGPGGYWGLICLFGVATLTDCEQTLVRTGRGPSLTYQKSRDRYGTVISATLSKDVARKDNPKGESCFYSFLTGNDSFYFGFRRARATAVIKNGLGGGNIRLKHEVGQLKHLIVSNGNQEEKTSISSAKGEAANRPLLSRICVYASALSGDRKHDQHCNG